MNSTDKYIFLVEWYDKAAELIRSYYLTYYALDGSVEMYDLKNKKQFLKRTQCSVDLKDLYIGGKVTIFSRQLNVVDYVDVFTRRKFENKKEKTFAMIKPDAYLHIGKILSLIEQNGFVICKMKMAKMTIEDASEFYAEHKGKPFYDELVNFISSDFIVGLELLAENAIKKWRDVLGPTYYLTARENAPNSIRGLFATGSTANAAHDASAQRELNFFFGNRLQSTAVLNNCSFCLIKPHVKKVNLIKKVLFEKKLGKIIDFILSEGFEISALEMFYLTKENSVEFFDVYKDVLPGFNTLIDHMTAGPCVALEVRQDNVVDSFRKLCGPVNPEIGKTLRKNTIRAIFGKNIVENAVHCTDFPEDGVLEVKS